MLMERTLVLVKPDGVVRALIGKIITAFEDAGLKIVALKMVKPTKELASRHYAEDKAWMESIGKKSLASYQASGIKVNQTALEIGMRVRNSLMDYLVGNPVVCIVVEGNEAISTVLKLVGSTSPHKADPATIRGRYASDSYALAESKKRAVRNIVHASDSKENAEREIKVWFTDKEILKYERADETAMY